MDYYILLPGDNEADAINDVNHIGTKSFSVFWAGEGLKALMHISENKPAMLEMVRIITSSGEKMTLPDFMAEIEPLQVRINKEN